jgi:TonB family protein
MRIAARPRLAGVAASIWLIAASPAWCGQETLDRAKALYLDAAYEDALAMLGSPALPASADGHLYRALCLLALGRADDADAAIAQSIEFDPTATATRQDVSPRVATLLTDARRRLLPGIARRLVAEGRALYLKGERPAAGDAFTRAMVLLDDRALAEDRELQDLRVLAAGFVDLVQAQLSAPVAPTAAASAPAAVRQSAPTTPAVVNPPAAAGPASTAKSEAPRAASMPSQSPTPIYTRAIPVTQTLPAWSPPDASWARREVRGSLRLTVDVNGRVVNATMIESLYPAYDRLLLEAVKAWRFQPARRDGIPIETDMVVPILIRPGR